MKQIVMITDGKPSALTLDDQRLAKVSDSGLAPGATAWKTFTPTH